MPFENLRATQSSIADELERTLLSSFLPRSILFSGKPGSSRLTGALDLAFSIAGGDRDYIRSPEIAFFPMRHAESECKAALSLFSRNLNESSRLFLIQALRKVLLSYHYSIAELYEGKKTVVKGAKDEDGKGDSTIFGNAEAVDAILMEMEDIHEWNEEATESIIKRLSSHLVPDFFTLGKKTPGATIDEIRAVQSWLEDGTEEKVVIFENVEDYTEGAKNSMLKMLEEPPSHSHIILISEYPSRLLETILSRVRRFSFPELSGAAISSFLCEKLMVFGDYPSFDAFYFDMTESDEDKHSVREAAVRYTEALLSGEMLSLEDESGIFQLLEKLSAYRYFRTLVKENMDKALSSGRYSVGRIRKVWKLLNFHISNSDIYNMSIRYTLDLALREAQIVK